MAWHPLDVSVFGKHFDVVCGMGVFDAEVLADFVEGWGESPFIVKDQDEFEDSFLFGGKSWKPSQALCL